MHYDVFVFFKLAPTRNTLEECITVFLYFVAPTRNTLEECITVFFRLASQAQYARGMHYGVLYFLD